MPFGVSLPELLILLVVLLLVFGAKRLPEMGRSLGKGMREFKEGVSGAVDDDVPEPAPPPPARELLPGQEETQAEVDRAAADSERQAVS
jgi:sec-independent protein translocase protein TatA